MRSMSRQTKHGIGSRLVVLLALAALAFPAPAQAAMRARGSVRHVEGPRGGSATVARGQRQVSHPRGGHPGRTYHGGYHRGRHHYHHHDDDDGKFVAGLVVGALAATAVTLAVTRDDGRKAEYYYYDGRYYQKSGQGYVVVVPPPGAAIQAPPDGHTTVYVRGKPYYYHAGTFYDHQPNVGYVVVEAPVGAVVPYIPTGYMTQVDVRSGRTYYVFYGVYYEARIVNGQTAYVVVNP